MDLSLQLTDAGPSAVGSVLRSNQAYFELLSQKHTLEWGIAFCCSRYPSLTAGNEFREVWIERPDETGKALAAVDALFADAGLNCHRWVLAEAQDPAVVEPALIQAGYRRRDMAAMALAAWPKDEAQNHASIRVLPARPMRSAYQRLLINVSESAAVDDPQDYTDAAIDRLDDHRMDMFVAMLDGAAAGAAALFQVGDIGRIVDLVVASDVRRRGVATALLDHLIRMARRLTMRVVCVEMPADDQAARALFARMGFVDAGSSVEFLSPSWPVRTD